MIRVGVENINDNRGLSGCSDDSQLAGFNRYLLDDGETGRKKRSAKIVCSRCNASCLYSHRMIGCRFGAIEGNHFAFGRCGHSSSLACSTPLIFSASSKSAQPLHRQLLLSKIEIALELWNLLTDIWRLPRVRKRFFPELHDIQQSFFLLRFHNQMHPKCPPVKVRKS